MKIYFIPQKLGLDTMREAALASQYEVVVVVSDIERAEAIIAAWDGHDPQIGQDIKDAKARGLPTYVYKIPQALENP